MLYFEIINFEELILLENVNLMLFCYAFGENLINVQYCCFYEVNLNFESIFKTNKIHKQKF